MIRPPSSAASTTWLLVRISPSSLRMMPEPEPPAPSAPATLIFTTEGRTDAATASGEPSGAGVSLLADSAVLSGARVCVVEVAASSSRAS